jgi:chemotaxis response regulator CheB
MSTTSEITTVIIDDLDAQREVLNEILFKHNEIEVVAEADSRLSKYSL